MLLGTAYSQEHLKTMVHAKFGGQTKFIMGNSKIENKPYKKCFQCNILQRVVNQLFYKVHNVTSLMHPSRTILRERPNGFSNYNIIEYILKDGAY